MTGPERDPDVDSWLNTRRELRAADAAHSLEPPAELDQLVIERARLELRRPAPTRNYFFRSSPFAVPISIAATLLLSFTLVLQFNRYESRQDAAATLADTSTAPLTISPAVAPETAAMPPQETAKQAAARPTASAGNDARAARSRSEVAPLRDTPVAANAAEADATIVQAAPAAAPALAVAPPAPSEVGAGPSREFAARGADSTGVAAAERVAPRPLAAWWDLVQRLQRDGRTIDAARELEALRKAYPEFVVPPGTALPAAQPR